MTENSAWPPGGGRMGAEADAEAALRASEERNRLIVEGARDYAILTTDPDGRIESWSPGAEAVFGWSAAEAVGQPVAMTFTPEDRAAGVPERERAAARREGSAPDVRWHVRGDGARVFIEGTTRALRGPGGALRGFLKIGQDVTRRRETEEALRRSEELLRELNLTLERRVAGRTAELAEANEALRKSEAKYRTLFESMDEGYLLVEVILDGEGRAVDALCLEANPAAVRMTGLAWAGRRLSEAGPDVEPYWLETFGRVAATGRRERGQRHVGAFGAWYDFSVFPVQGAEHPRLAIVFHDITERRRAEAARHEALRRLVTAEEDERRRLSRELHDSLGQLVTGLLLGLKELERSSADASRIADLERLAEQIARGMQHVAVELRPPALDNLGLAPALRGHLEEWSARYGIEADFHSVGLRRGRLPAETETALYRVVQEGLTNVVRHAGATQVNLLLERRAGRITAILEDDGVGFDVERTLASPEKAGRLGVRGMRERVALLGGELEIESSPGSGTTLFVRLPDPAIPPATEEAG